MRKALLALVLVGCNKGDPGPGCPQVVDRMLEITKQQMAGDRAQLVRDCEDRKLSRQARLCFAGAKTLDDLAACQKLAAPAGGAGSAH